MSSTNASIALNIAAFRPLEDFGADMERLIESIKSAQRAEGVEEVFYPGELEAQAEERNRADGVAIPADTLAELNAGARELGIEGLAD